MHVYMCICACVSLKKNIYIFFKNVFNFVLIYKKCIDDGRCICMSVCMYMELNWFPSKGKNEKKKKNELTNQ